MTSAINMHLLLFGGIKLTRKKIIMGNLFLFEKKDMHPVGLPYLFQCNR